MYLAFINMIRVSVRKTEIILDLSRKVNLIERISYTIGKIVDFILWVLFVLDWGQLTMIWKMSDLWAILWNCKNKVR